MEVSEAAVVEGKEACRVCEVSMSLRRNGACPPRALSRALPKPSTITTQMRLAIGSPRTFSNPSTPRAAAALGNSSAMVLLP